MRDRTGRGERRRALIIGGSMSGLLAGLKLREHDWDVDIYERVESELSGRGAGIVAQPELIATLRALGLDTRELGVEMEDRVLIVLPDCPEFVWTWFGAARIGAVLTMVNPLLPADDYRYYLEYTRARTAIVPRLARTQPSLDALQAVVSAGELDKPPLASPLPHRIRARSRSRHPSHTKKRFSVETSTSSSTP